MLNAYEQRLMAFYLANAASTLHYRDREASDLADWIADRENRVAFGGRKRPSLMRAGKRGRDDGLSGGRWRALGETLREEYAAARKARPDRTGQRLRRLARTTGLSRTDVDLLELVLRYQTQPVIESMIDDVFRSSRRYTPLNVQNPALPSLLGVSANTVQGRLRADSPLVRSGLVCIDTDGDLKALDRLNRLAAAAPAGSETDVHRLLLDAAPASELDWSDFDHVARDRDHVERVITGALASGAPGVNILLAPAQVKEAFRIYFALPAGPPPASRTSPRSRPGTSRSCTARRRFWGSSVIRRRSPACFAPSATRSRPRPRPIGFRP